MAFSALLNTDFGRLSTSQAIYHRFIPSHANSHPNKMKDIRKSTEAFLHDQTIAIALENCSQTFTLSKAMLCNASSYFSAALNGHFRESTDHILRLPGCDENVLIFFVYYLTHHEKLPTLGSEDENEDEGAEKLSDFDPNSTWSQRVIFAIRLWRFADACLMPKLQNKAMRLCCTELKNVRVNASIARAAFEGTSMESPLRKAVIDEAMWDWIPRGPKESEAYEAMMNEVGAIPGVFSCFYRAQETQKMGFWEEKPSSGESWERYRSRIVLNAGVNEGILEHLQMRVGDWMS